MCSYSCVVADTILAHIVHHMVQLLLQTSKHRDVSLLCIRNCAQIPCKL